MRIANRHTAQQQRHGVVDIALLDGEVTVDSFTNERLNAPDVRALLPKTTLTFDDNIPFDKIRMYIIVNVWTKDGRHLVKRIDKLLGWPGNPLTREQRHRKFFSCVRRVLDERAANRMLELTENLETLPDPRAIMDIARCDR